MSHLEIIRPHRASRLERFRDSVRSYWLGPWSTKDKALARYMGGRPSSAGVAVNEHTAMNYSAVWAAVNLIAGHIGSVPLILYKLEKDGGKIRYTNHPLYRLLHDRPNPQMSSSVFRRTLTAHKMIWGNGYAEIERDVSDRPVALWPLMPYAVQPYLDRGVLRYRVFNPTTAPTELDARDVLHIRGLCEDGTCGQSLIPAARESFGLGIAAERFGATFFGNGSTFGGVISYPSGVGANTQVRKENREAIEKVHTGVERAHKFLALYEGANYQTLGVPPNAAQFLETREFQIEEVCRWFNVPPHKLKHLKRSTNNNIEHQSIEYVTDTLDPHWVDWEEELTIKLIAPLERNLQEIEHIREGLLRGDSAARGEFYSKLFSLAAISPNEIRARENMNPIQGGDTVYVPLNTLPLDRIGEYYDAIIKSKEAPPPPPAPKPDPKTDDEIKALREELEAARRRAQEQEDAGDLVRAELLTVRVAMGVLETVRVDAQAALDVYARRDAAILAAGGTPLELALMAEREALTGQATAVEARSLELDAVVVSLRAEKQTADGALEQATRVRREAEARELVVIGERDAALARANQAAAFVSAAEADRSAARAAVDAAESAARVAEDTASTMTAQAELLSAERNVLVAETETLRTDLARARADIASELERARTHKVTMLAAMRSLFVHASERLLAKESTAARKHQQSPEKLRDWIARFFDLHAETAREAFQPLVGPWTALTGGAPGVLLDRLVAEHIETSTTALRLVAETDDADELAANLERTLSRWEHERADAMADALVREGMSR